MLALAVSYALTRHLPAMPLITAIIVLVFGSLTLLLHDEHFIKLKPTIIYVLFGGVLLGGLAFGKPLLGMVFDSVFQLTEEGWRKLTLRWALFFFALAVLNEIVWRTQIDRYVGELQGVRRGAAHVRIRRLAISAVDEIRGAGKDGGAIITDWQAPSRSRPYRRFEIVRRERPDQFVGDAAVAIDDEGLGHPIYSPFDRRAAVAVDAVGRKWIAIAAEEAPRVIGLVLVVHSNDADAGVRRERDEQRRLVVAGHAP